MRIRTAILGYGRSGSSMHAGAIAANSPFELVAVCDIDPARQQQAAERFGCKIYDDYHQMLGRERLDLVCVITRSDQHCPMACDCLAAGANVLVTKPWALDQAQARRMIAAAQESGRQLLPWLPSRWGSDLCRLRELLAAGAIGEVFLVRRSVCSFSTRNDWQTLRRHGGGYLLNWGPHIVDTPLVLLGSPPRSVYARMKRTINPGDGEDVFLALVTLESGALVQAEFTIAAEHLPSWFVQGTAGTIVVRGRELLWHRETPPLPDDPTRYSSRDEGGETTQETLAPALYGDENQIYAELAQALQGERPFPVTTAHALELTRVLDAIRTSAERDKVVRL